MTGFTPQLADAAAALARIGRLVAGEEQLMDDYCRAVWSCLVEPGDRIAGTLIEAVGAEEALRAVISGGRGGATADAAGIGRVEWRDAVARWSPRLLAREVDAAFLRAEHAGASLLVPGDPGWPDRVDDLGPHRPVCLWTRGSADYSDRDVPAVAIVGARAATSYGEGIAMEIAGELAARGVTVVSGAAYGIDGSAHRAAITAGGRTVAVLAGGVDRPYPAGHTRLLEDITAAGAVHSEVPCGGTPTRWRFLQRNRLIAAMADATIVVEAGRRSGSLNTAHHASDLGRPLGAVPGPVTSASSAGCHILLRGPDTHCITSADDAAELLGLERMDARSRAGSVAGADGGAALLGSDRTDDRTRVRDALSFRSWRGTDDIARQCGMAPAEVEAHLGLMTLAGEVVVRDGGWRRVALSAG